jgi:hypothetical protein
MSLGVKAGRCMRLTTYNHIVLISRNLGALTLLDPSGPAWPVMGVLYPLLVISNLYVVTVNKSIMGFFCHYSIFFRIPLNVLVRTPDVAYLRLGITGVEELS